MNILFINVCVRQNSRTKRLADHLLALVEGEITEVCLEKEDLQPLSGALLNKRDELLSDMNREYRKVCAEQNVLSMLRLRADQSSAISGIRM